MREQDPDDPGPDDGHIIFVTAFRHYRTGKLITAASCGKKAFAFRVRDKRKA